MAFQCVVVTPEQQALDESITQAILPAHDGEIGILTDHAPLLVKLGLGALRLDLPGGSRRVLYIEGGVAQMRDNHLTILTQEAIPRDQISRESARAELAEAQAWQTTDAKDAQERQRRITRAKAKESLATK